MKTQDPENRDLERVPSSWSCIDLTLIAVRFAEEANMRRIAALAVVMPFAGPSSAGPLPRSRGKKLAEVRVRC